LLAAEESAPPRRSYNLQPKETHFQPKAKAVIQLMMQGGPSQVDLFDPKPELDRNHGKSILKDIAKDLSSPESAGGLMRSPFKFAQQGKSGTWVSELLPHLAKHVDDIAVVRSMFNTHQNHEPAIYKIQSGKTMPGLPTMGAWVAYGLGTENQNLPAFVVLSSPEGRLPTNHVQNWQSGYLPPIFQGTLIRSKGTPILNLRPEVEEPSQVEKLSRDLLSKLDRIHRKQRPGQLQLDARIASYELAARMQLSASDALAIDTESAATLDEYGIGDKTTDAFGRQCLLARRLVERGVRFVQVYPVGQQWDNHNNIGTSLPSICGKTDKPIGALLADLKQRGLLKDVLVVWGGEFGRLPVAQLRPGADVKKAGRDHGPNGFSVWFAGAGVKAGVTHGATDEIGWRAAENRVSVNDWHATILHLLGMNNEQLYFESRGFKEKLTGIEKVRIIKEILA
ncbi:MAG: DUF1501 domain-containing protein, partial [Pirellulaceae bacterium]|nr:DUF1501 domain-containing protein [Pirellulaceae bacterium]